jgi:hypothetical protein
MTPFDPNKHTLAVAMKITDPEDAKQYLEAMVDHCQKIAPEKTREECLAIQKANLGYFAGYYTDDTRERVERLFDCAHPVFGKITEHKVTDAEAFAMGVKMGEEARRKRERKKLDEE